MRLTIVITGFNTDVEHDGTVYHVQTEDKGLDSPLILSLVYVGGAILASKRSPYDDLIIKGFNEKELADRLNRQHKLICAAIRSGRIEDLKRMSQRDTPGATASAKPVPEKAARKSVKQPAKQPRVEQADPLEIPPVQAKAEALPQVEAAATPATPPEVKVKKSTPPPPSQKGIKQSVRSILHEVVADFARAEAASDAEIHLSLVDEKEFRGGVTVMLKIRVGRGPGGREAISGADITVKVLGSTFRPLIFPTSTGPDGIATVRAVLPHFQTGRAALLVRAIADGYEAELRRIIHQG
ncbi:MAG TPA: hypothetical protein VGO69_05335 [Pyrinomonadaceae bacterium]|nr:hypothetical protein [Pyrinomonadaceae bacterium]